MFASFLPRSLQLLSQEHARAYRAMCHALGQRTTRIAVGLEVTVVCCDGGTAQIVSSSATADIECVTSHSAILDLLDARATLVESILADRVQLRGDLADLIAFHDGLAMYVHGAVRCPSFHDLLRQYRTDPQPDERFE